MGLFGKFFAAIAATMLLVFGFITAFGVIVYFLIDTDVAVKSLSTWGIFAISLTAILVGSILKKKAEKPQEVRAEKPQEVRAEKPQEVRAEKPQEVRVEKPQEVIDESHNDDSDFKEKLVGYTTMAAIASGFVYYASSTYNPLEKYGYEPDLGAANTSMSSDDIKILYDYFIDDSLDLAGAMCNESSEFIISDRVLGTVSYAAGKKIDPPLPAMVAEVSYRCKTSIGRSDRTESQIQYGIWDEEFNTFRCIRGFYADDMAEYVAKFSERCHFVPE